MATDVKPKLGFIKPDGQDEIPVLFYPNKYSLEKSNQIAEIGVPGLSSPILQYVRGNTRTLSLELFFDTYEQRADVRPFTNKIYGLLGIEGKEHVPPICTVTWGNLNFRGVLERVSGSFTLFLPDGIPARATLSVSFKEYIEVEVEVRSPARESADHVKTWTVTAGDSLWSIAAAEYDDPAKWRPIAKQNGIDNPRCLEPGRVLVIPRLR
jgi:hypothetical protein